MTEPSQPRGSLRVALLGSREKKPEVVEEARHVREAIGDLVEIVAEDFDDQVDLNSIDAELAIVMGGDGSILRAVGRMGYGQIPVLGVNLGKLGFLADLLPAELPAALQQIRDGRYRVVDHLMLQGQLLRDDQAVFDELALNEVAILNGPPFSMLSIELYVDAELATTYSCDGLIVSTPIGSTAHNLSAGGPIVRKNLKAVVISALNPHTLTVRPIVDSADRVYEVVVRDPGPSTSLVVDGRCLGELLPGDRIRIVRAEPVFQLIEVEGHGYYRTLREKLGWSGNAVDRKTTE